MDLDNLDAISRLDKQNIRKKIDEFPNQIEQGWKGLQHFALPPHFLKAKHIVVLGMGGSGIGGELVRTLGNEKIKLPVTIVHDYTLPGFVNKDCLVIAVSYSGNTEETLFGFEQATKKTSMLLAITTGGKLASLTRKYRTPLYQFAYDAQPRAALGYLFTGVFGVLSRLGIIHYGADEVDEAVVLLRGLLSKLTPEIQASRNPAKRLATELLGKIPVVFGSGTLSEVARRWKGEFNENAKTLSFYEVLPELNHNLLVGLEFPKWIRGQISVLMLQSKYDHPRNKRRQAITMQILEKRRIQYESVMMQPSGGPLSEILLCILYGDYVSYYLSLLNGVNPTPVEIIDYLKDQLASK